MKKDDIISLLVYAIMIAFAVVVGMVVIQPAIKEGFIPDEGSAFAFLIISLLIGIVINGVLIEVGHLIGAKIGKYDILSINIFGFAIYKVKNNDKLETKFSAFKSFDGLCGETIITPKNEKSKPMPFIMAPLFLFLIEIACLVIVFNFIKDVRFEDSVALMGIKYGLFIITSLGAMLMIYNYFPAKLDSANDGYRLVSVSKKINHEAYNELLKVNGDRLLGNEIKEIKTFEVITDFTAKVNLMSANLFIESDFEKSMQIIDNLLNNEKNISKHTFQDIKITKMLALFLNDKNDEANELYKSLNDDEKKYLISCNNLLTVRTYLFYASRIENSSSEIARALERATKLLKQCLPVEKIQEEELLNKTKEKLNLK